jgi:4-diphosphocytidyl-2-C-methyl-D-erythritol kinase
MSTLAVHAHAKINLDLRIVGRRADGYHDLRTIYQSLSLHDRLVFHLRRGPFALESAHLGVPRDASNLVWRAAQALWSASGRSGQVRGVAVSIDKRIPAQAGLGGGSSDAAVTLVALNSLWHARLDAGDLVRLASGLGSDVPYFVLGGTALGLGRGELLYPLPDVPAMGVLIVMPSFGVSTADAYRWFAARGQRADNIQALTVPWYPGPMPVANDLEPAVMRHRSALMAVRRALLRRRAEVSLMSGSGSAVFGLFPTVADARAAATFLGRNRSSGDGRPWRTIVTRSLGRGAYKRSLGVEIPSSMTR